MTVRDVNVVEFLQDGANLHAPFESVVNTRPI
jgi:hypothetical protein